MPSPFVPPEINVSPRNGRAPLIVGRDPGSDESRTRKPFVGQAGRLLFGGIDTFTGTDVSGALALAGLTRKQVNITNRVLRQPTDNIFAKHNPRDVEDGKVQLLKLIEELNPSIIVATGCEAAYDLVPGWATLTDRHPGEFSGGKSIWEAAEIMDRRGFLWYEHDLPTDAPVLVTLHPAACLYQAMPNRLMLDMDFTRMGAVLNGSLPRRAWPDMTRIYRERDMEEVWESSLVAYDIETQWGGDKLLCIGLYTREGRGFLAYSDAFGAVERWLRSDRPKLCHNGQFDRYFMDAKLGVPVGGKHDDTIVGHWACYPELAGKEDTGREDQKKKSSYTLTRKGLNFLASFHLNVEWWKTYTSDSHVMGRLCVNDVAATMWCWDVVEPELEAMNVRAQYDRQMRKIPALIQIQKRGFLIDEDLRTTRIKALSGRGDELAARSKQAAESYIIAQGLTHRPDGKEYWWYHAARCDCCGGGSLARAHCLSCAGLSDKKKPTLIQWAWRNSKGTLDRDVLKKHKTGDLYAMVPACRVCNGRGKLDTWDFNPMSSTQMADLLFTHLKVPKSCAPGGEPGADDEILGRVLAWAQESKE